VLRRLACIAGAMLVMGGIAVGGLAPPASAAEDCDTIVIDDAHVLGDRAAVEAAARTLMSQGVEVRVRTTAIGIRPRVFKDYDDYLNRIAQRCSSWQNPRLLVFAMNNSADANQRAVTVDAGIQWKPAIEGNGVDTRIQSIMGARFGSRSFDLGFIEGMKEAGHVLDAYANPRQGGGGTTVIDQRKPTDLSGLWTFLKWLLGVVVLGGIAGFAIWWILKRRRDEATRIRMRQRARSARDGATLLLDEVGASTREAVRRSKVNSFEGLDDERARELVTALATVTREYEAATSGLASAVSASGQAGDDNLTTGVYEDMAQRYEAILGHARAAAAADKRIDELTVELDGELTGLKQAIEGTQADIDKAKQELVDGKSCFERVSTGFLGSLWESVRGNGTEAMKRITAAMQALQPALALLDTTNRQEQFAALAAVNEAKQLLAKARGLLRSITELEANLLAARQQAPAEIDAAAADIELAEQYIGQHDDDVREELEADLRRARQTLVRAREALRQEKPDYLQVVRLAQAANAEADRIYKESVDEYHAAERLRRQAATMLQQARAAVSRAGEYIDDHDADVGSSAKNDLERAKRYLAQAERAKTPADVLEAATLAEREANDAFSKAKDDFEEAEARHQPSYDSGGFTTGVVVGSAMGQSQQGGGWGSSPSASSAGDLSGGATGFGGGDGRLSGGATGW
jgi:hypothetical protein